MDKVDRINKAIAINEKKLREALLPSDDVIFKSLTLLDKNKEKVSFLLVYIRGLTKDEMLNEYILRPLYHHIKDYEEQSKELEENLFYYALDVRKTDQLIDMINEVPKGYIGIFIEGSNNAFLVSMDEPPKREVSVTETEQVAEGSQEAFVEHFGTNIALVRRRIQDPNLRIITKEVGEEPAAKTAVLYMDGTAQTEVVEEVYRRLEKIKRKGIVGLQSIKETLGDQRFCFFPQVLSTERPDRVVNQLIKGKVAIILQGNPYVCIVPAVYIDFIQSMDDVNERSLYGNVIKIVRLIAVTIAVTLPSAYVALLSFHYELLNPNLIVMLGESRSQVPFPPIVEVLLMEFITDLVREASIRLPKNVVQTIGIVGALILGQASVSAGIVSPIMILIVAVTTIATSVIPNYSFAYGLRFMRYIMIFLTGVLGGYGISIGWMLILAHLCNMSSMGFAYLSPIAPLRIHDWKDTVLQKSEGIVNDQRKEGASDDDD